MSQAPALSVIIPTLNEEERLEKLLSQLKLQEDVELEVIVCDGGSHDRTCEIASSGKALLLETDRGRGKQMNAGARVATSDFLLFLHADSELQDPKMLSTALLSFLAQGKHLDGQAVAGHFPLEFVVTGREKNFAYFFYEEKTALNRRHTTNGDQGFLLLKGFFERLGGFDETMSFLEDKKFAEEVDKSGKWITLPGRLQTSARRFETEGLSRRMVLSAITMALDTIEFSAFFRQAPEIYRQHRESSRLQLAPYFSLLHQLSKEAGLSATTKHWIAIGRYVKENSWQLFFLSDVVLRRVFGRKQNSMLGLYDCFAVKVLSLKVFDVAVGALTCAWFYTSWFYYSLRETGDQQRDTSNTRH